MNAIRLGKRSEGRSPLIRDFVPLTGLDQLVFAAWDPIPDNAYEAALRCGVLDAREHVAPIRDFLEPIRPLPAAFDRYYVKRLDGPNVNHLATKRDLAERFVPTSASSRPRTPVTAW